MKQQGLFTDINPAAAKKSLAIGKASKQPLSKNQLAFNKLTERIERLHKEIEKKQEVFDAAIQLYAQKVFPKHRKMVLQKRELMDVLWKNYKSKRLSATDQRHLKTILQEHLQELLHLLEVDPDDRLKAMFRELEGETYEAFLKRNVAAQKAEMQEMFDDLDVAIDLDEVDFRDKAEIAKKLEDVKEKLRERQEMKNERREQRRKLKKQTKGQQEKEALKQAGNDLKQKNISTIYKQLAKLFHPDLEQDEIRKAEKEILMKELTAAYESKNLHALLSLEIKWIHNETDHLETLTEEKLAVYLQILRDQAEQLEKERNELFLQPRYAILYQQFGPSITRQPLAIVKEAVNDLEAVISDLSRDINDYASEYGLRHIKNLIKQWKQMRRQQPPVEEDYLRMFFS